MKDSKLMRPVQMKMARAALGLSVRALSEATELSEFTVKRVERGADALASTINRLSEFYRANGVRFVEDGDAVGVMLTPPPQPDLFEKEGKGSG